MARKLYCALIAFASAVCVGAPSVSGTVSGADGKAIAGAVVFVQDIAPSPSGTHNPPQIVDQINKAFVPEVLPIVVGTLVRFPNHDQIHHHVYSFSPAKTFELPLYKGEDAAPVLFDKVGVVKIGCNIHDWMSGIILVLPNAHFSMTDADGHYTLNDLPAGNHTLSAWHALSKLKTEETARTVQIGEANTEVSFTLPLAPARPRRALHGARSEP
jgi:plastocyanin